MCNRTRILPNTIPLNIFISFHFIPLFIKYIGHGTIYRCTTNIFPKSIEIHCPLSNLKQEASNLWPSNFETLRLAAYKFGRDVQQNPPYLTSPSLTQAHLNSSPPIIPSSSLLGRGSRKHKSSGHHLPTYLPTYLPIRCISLSIPVLPQE
jgi:hypothetical protein